MDNVIKTKQQWKAGHYKSYIFLLSQSLFLKPEQILNDVGIADYSFVWWSLYLENWLFII